MSASQQKQVAHDVTQSFVQELLLSALCAPPSPSPLHQKRADGNDGTDSSAKLSANDHVEVTSNIINQFVRQLLLDSVRDCSLLHQPVSVRPQTDTLTGSNTDTHEGDSDSELLRERAFSFVRRVLLEGMSGVQTGLDLSTSPLPHSCEEVLSPRQTLTARERAHDSVVAELTTHIAALERQMSQQRVTHDQALAEAHTTCTDLQAMCQALQQTLSDSQQEVHTREAEFRALTERSRADADRLQREIGGLRVKHDLVAKSLCEVQDREDHFRKKIVATEAEVADKAAKYDKLLLQLKEDQRRHHAEGTVQCSN